MQGSETTLAPSWRYPPTRATLLERVKQGDDRSWEDFYLFYSRLIVKWCAIFYHEYDPAFCHQVVQSVMIYLHEKGMMAFNPQIGRFHSFLSGVTKIKVYECRRARYAVRGEEDCLSLSESQQNDDYPGNAELGRHLRLKQRDRLVALERAGFLAESLRKLREDTTLSPVHLRAFALLLEGEKPEAVAVGLGLEKNHIYQIKHRMLSRLKQLYEKEAAQ